MVNMDEILELVVKKDASDVHLICGNKPVLRIARELTVVDEMEVLTPQMYYVLLVLHQPMHGYEIMNKITEITHGEITVGAGSLYTLLPKFEKECYIQLVKVENNKKIYQITNLGKKKLQKEKERLQSEIQRATKMLSNPGFVNKAPAEKIQEEKDKKAKYEDMLVLVESRLLEIGNKS